MATVQWGAGDDSDNELEEAEARFLGKTALLVVIDCSPRMFEKWGDEKKETPFLSAIKCCESMWRSKVVSNAKDVVGILLLGTEQKKNRSEFQNLYLLQELSSVKVEMIKELIEIRKSPDDLNGFKRSIGSADQYDLKNLFWLAKVLFDDAKTQTFAKKMMFFTCEDNPHANQPLLQQDAIGKFKDLGKIELNIVSFKQEFDFSKFYSRILEDEASIVYSSKLDSLMKVVRMKQKLRRPIVRVTFEILPGVKIGVGVYTFVRPAPSPAYVSINRRNNEIIEKTTNVFRAASGVPILQSEERKVVNIQGENAVFTNQELKEIKYNVGTTGIRLIGFLKYEQFDPFRWYRSPGHFLYPDEDSIAGSKDFFTALLKRCHILKKIPLVTMVLSRGRTPKIACLLPSVPEVNAQGEEVHQIFPQGFHVFTVPFTDEIRKMDFELSDTSAPEQMIQLMEKVVKKLSFKKFDLLEVKNPQLQSKWKRLEEEALEEEVSEDEACDLTEPNEDLMKEKLGNLTKEIEQASTRSGTWFSTTKAVAPSKAKVDIAVEAKHGRLDRCTVVMMKEFLDQRRVPYPKFVVKAKLIDIVKNTCGISD